MKHEHITVAFDFDPSQDQVSSPEARAGLERAARALGERLGRAAESRAIEAIFGQRVATDHAIARIVGWDHNDATASDPADLADLTPHSASPRPGPEAEPDRG